MALIEISGDEIGKRLCYYYYDRYYCDYYRRFPISSPEISVNAIWP